MRCLYPPSVSDSACLQPRATPIIHRQLEPLKVQFPRMEKVWADQGYTGKGREWINEHMGWDVEIVRHSWPARD
jgi:hypothetical protein